MTHFINLDLGYARGGSFKLNTGSWGRARETMGIRARLENLLSSVVRLDTIDQLRMRSRSHKQRFAEKQGMLVSTPEVLASFSASVGPCD